MSQYEYISPARSQKVAIPRLQHRDGQSESAAKDRRRVSRACTACRSHKIKCTGDQPSCRHCENSNRECVYVMPRKDRVKILTERCIQMASLLNALKTRVGGEEAARIRSLVAAAEEDVPEIRNAPAPLSSIDQDNDDSKHDILNPSPQLPASTDITPLDLLNEDLLQDELAQATGFVGMSSEVQWLRIMMAHLSRAGKALVPEPPLSRRHSAFSIDVGTIGKVSSFTYNMDGHSVDVNHFVDPHELPTPETAIQLLDCYTATVHDTFPILPKRALEEFRKHFEELSNGTPFRLRPKCQAMLNLILAIGARYSHLIRAEWQGDERDHVIYQARARAFGLNEFALTDHPDVPQIQVAGLLSFYYISVGQISRAWIIMGTALRFANALGLHVRNEDPSATATKRELMVRIWWSLYSLERLLSILTGRPGVVVDSTCSVPLPMPVPEDQLSDDVSEMEKLRKMSSTTPTHSPGAARSFPSTSPPSMVTTGLSGHPGLYFKAIVELGMITQNILTSLYSAGTMIQPLEMIHQNIVQLGQSLDNWARALPEELNVQSKPTGPRRREQMILGMYSRSAKILLTRPCMGGLGHVVRGQPFLDSFAHRMAGVCVGSAKATVNCLPDQTDSGFLYEYGPWWCIVHHLMQALSVFLLALVFMAPPPQDIAGIAPYIQKILNWLHVMQDPVAERAYHVAVSSVQTVAASLSVDLSGDGLHAVMSHSMTGDDVGPFDGCMSPQSYYPSFVPVSMAESSMSTPIFDPVAGRHDFPVNPFLMDQ